MTQNMTAENGVDACAGVQYKILAKPGHRGAKEKEHAKCDRNDGEGARGLVHDHLVDDHLGSERRRKTDELNEKRGQQHVAPNRFMSQKFVREPPEAEGA